MNLFIVGYSKEEFIVQHKLYNNVWYGMVWYGLQVDRWITEDMNPYFVRLSKTRFLSNYNTQFDPSSAVINISIFLFQNFVQILSIDYMTALSNV